MPHRSGIQKLWGAPVLLPLWETPEGCIDSSRVHTNPCMHAYARPRTFTHARIHPSAHPPIHASMHGSTDAPTCIRTFMHVHISACRHIETHVFIPRATLCAWMCIQMQAYASVLLRLQHFFGGLPPQGVAAGWLGSSVMRLEASRDEVPAASYAPRRLEAWALLLHVLFRRRKV